MRQRHARASRLVHGPGGIDCSCCRPRGTKQDAKRAIVRDDRRASKRELALIDEPLTAEDIARLRREAAECEEQEREEQERAYEMYLRDRERGLS